MQTTNTNWIANYTFNAGNGGFTSATWDGSQIVFAGPSVDVYTAVWALTDISIIRLTIGGVDYDVSYAGSSTPGHPQDVTLWTNSTPPAAGPNVIDNIYIEILQGVVTFIEVDGTDIRMEAGDDVRIFSNDAFRLINRSTGQGIEIIVDDNTNSKTFEFKVDGNLALPLGGTIVDSNGTNLLSSGGSTLPADANGYLRNDGSGTLSWQSNTVTAGSPAYSDVWVNSVQANGFWTTYTLTGDIRPVYYNGSSTTITLSSQAVSGKQFSSGDKILVINDTASLNGNDYGMVIEFPANPTIGDTFVVPFVSTSGTTTMGVSEMVSGRTYTIASVGTTTNWGAIGIFGPVVGQEFAYNYPAGYLSGDATVTGTGLVGITKVIFKPAAGQRAIILDQGGSASTITFGPDEDIIAVYIDLSSGFGPQGLTWVYAGYVDSTPTWYQVWG
jgi:hypothetical protein